MLLLPGTELSVAAAAWLVLDVTFLSALFLHLLRDGGHSTLCSVFQDLIRYGKTKISRPAWLRCFDLPKRWFYHFYLVSVVWNGALLCLVVRWLLYGVHLPEWLQLLLHFFNKEPQQHISGGELSTLLALSLIWLHSVRRLVECLFVSVYSGGVINLAHYGFGLGFYILNGITLLDHSRIEERQVTASDLASQVNCYHILGTVLFLWASVHHHRCHVILANLRKNTSGKVVSMAHALPRGDWFEKVSCPHYFAELLIYIAIAILFGLAHTTWWLVVLLVLFNQSLSAILCHEFYLQKFDDYPVDRKVFIPYVF
ncbi:polyprenal reductase [Gastrophryne carolinensis]